MSPTQTKGQLQAKIATAITQFDREHLGCGPHQVRAMIIPDMILLRLQGVLTPLVSSVQSEEQGGICV